MHSTFSDGVLTPERLVEKAVSYGVTMMAITDHDTFAGADSLQSVRTSMPVMIGIELSLRDMSQLHLLGYGTTRAEGLRAAVDDLARQRVTRAQKMLRRLDELGMPLDDKAVADLSEGTVGRPHIARAMVAAGYVETIQEAFERYLGDGRPAYVPGERLSMREALSLMRGSGFVPVLAHPALLQKDDVTLRALLHQWKDQGLMGVEVYHPSMTAKGYGRLERMTRGLGLLVTGGSDFHQESDGHGMPGCTAVDWRRAEEDVLALRQTMEKEKQNFSNQ